MRNDPCFIFKQRQLFVLTVNLSIGVRANLKVFCQAFFQKSLKRKDNQSGREKEKDIKEEYRG